MNPLTRRLGELVSFKTGKLDSNAAVVGGDYPFFTCSREVFRTNTFAFDAEAVLLAGNNANGDFPIHYFVGKFDAYQRTYVIRAQDETCLSNRYLYYALQLELDLLKRLSTGATTKFLTLTILNNLEIPCPPLDVQRRIAGILSAYDDLIENNTRRIKLLEQAAHDLYREWFVEFRFPGHESVETIDSGTEFGAIPRGWEVKPIGEVVEYHIGGGWGEEVASDTFPDSAYVIRGTDIPDARLGRCDNVPFRFHKRSNLGSRMLQPDDIVFEVSGGSKGQPVGRSLLVSERLLSRFPDPVMCASFCKLIRAKKALLPAQLLYLHLLEIYENGRINKYQVQSTGITNFKFTVFLESENLIVASQSIVYQAIEHLKPLFDKIQILGQRNANLRETRDLLLPRLVSGELDVSDLDIQIGAES